MPGVVVVTGTSTSGPGRVAQPDKVTASTTVIAKCAYRRPPGSRLCGMAMTRSAFQADDGLRPDRDASGANSIEARAGPPPLSATSAMVANNCVFTTPPDEARTKAQFTTPGRITL